MLKMPPKTDVIFDKLSKGDFICSNTANLEMKTLYEIIEDN